MRKTVTCSKCQRPFVVEGTAGTMRSLKQGVVCPYQGCWEQNEIEWTIDGTFKATEIYIPPKTEN